jgi:hypothetical protein
MMLFFSRLPLGEARDVITLPLLERGYELMACALQSGLELGMLK